MYTYTDIYVCTYAYPYVDVYIYYAYVYIIKMCIHIIVMYIYAIHKNSEINARMLRNCELFRNQMVREVRLTFQLKRITKKRSCTMQAIVEHGS